MTEGSSKDITKLIDDLASADSSTRMTARTALVEIGPAATPALLKTLDSPQSHTRWEAAKALTEITDPNAAQRLADALGDEDEDVRWVIAEALIALGPGAVMPLLNTLSKGEQPDELYKGAHHVLHDLAKAGQLSPQIEPVLKALEHSEPAVTVPPAANDASRHNI